MRKSRPYPLPRVGNDVVDLAHPACQGRSPGDRLLSRILSEKEHAWLDSGTDALWPVRLWALWAAKETAFKVGAKSEGASVFAPATLECSLTIEAPPGGFTPAGGKSSAGVHIEGTVLGPGSNGEVRVEGTSDGNLLHVVGWSPAKESPPPGFFEVGVETMPEGDAEEALDSFRGRFSEVEWQGVHSIPSARVRLLVRERLRTAIASRGAPGAEDPADQSVEILTSRDRPGRTPPRIRIAGEDRPDLDVSLSHHGRYLAWALLFPHRT